MSNNVQETRPLEAETTAGIENRFRIVNGPTMDQMEAVAEICRVGGVPPFSLAFHLEADVMDQPMRVAVKPIKKDFHKHAALQLRIHTINCERVYLKGTQTISYASYQFRADVMKDAEISHTSIQSFTTVSGIYSPIGNNQGYIELL